MMNRIHGPLRALIAVAATISIASPVRAGEASGFEYHYFDEARPLKLDASRVAIFFENNARSTKSEGAALASVGLAPARAEAWAVGGWSLVPLDESAAKGDAEATIRGIVEALSRVEAARGKGGAGGADRMFVSPVFVDAMGGPMFVTPQILVGFRDGVDEARALEILGDVGGVEVLESGWAELPGAFRLRGASASGIDVLERANALASLDEVAWAEPDMVFTGRGGLTPNDAGYSNCWGLHNTGQLGGTPDADMDASEAWDITTGDASIITLIIDTGIDVTHPDVNQVTGIDTTTDFGDGGPVNSFDNHGTPVGGCVSAIINNSIGTVGVAPTTKVASARTFISINSQGNWTSQSSWTVNSLSFAENIGARVTNNSNGYGFSSSSIATKYTSTRNTGGMVHFGSAGNDASVGSSYPASLSSVNSVSALDDDASPASFTNTGPDIAFSAPGVSVYSTDRQGSPGYSSSSYTFVQGTSFASPYTAGVAALVLSIDATRSAEDVETIMKESAVDYGPPGRDDTYGHGFVNARGALDLMFDPPLGFGLSLPTNGSVTSDDTPQFTWSRSATADTYRLLVDDDPGFGSPEIDTTSSSLFYNALPGELDSSTMYHWKVIAENTHGTTDSTPSSQTFSTPAPPLPGTFTLTSPINGSVDVPLEPTFAWGASSNAATYRIRVSILPNLALPDIDETLAAPITSYQPGPGVLDDDTQYYWNVIAENVTGTRSGSPSLSGFRTEVPAPTCTGDFNGDDTTDVFDFNIFAPNFGRTDLAPFTGGDLDGDGDVDVFDFNIFAPNFGCVVGSR